MTTVLPLNTVVHITDHTGKRYGYGLEVRPAVGAPAQHWLLYFDHPPATNEDEPRMLPEGTIWQPTDDADWIRLNTASAFLERVRSVIELPRTMYATVHYSDDRKQPDVGGFEIFQRGRSVGAGWVTHEAGVYQEAWNLSGGFSSAEGFGFQYTPQFGKSNEEVGTRARRRLKELGADPADYLTTVLFDVRYYPNRLP